MRIGELVKKTGVPKETLHFYIRQGLLPRPRRVKGRLPDYSESHIRRVLWIRELREEFFLPIPEIKKILRQNRRQSRSDRAVSAFHNRYFRPLDRLLSREIVGRRAFCEATGLGRKWLEVMEDWGIVTAGSRGGRPAYSGDDVIIGRLIVDMDRLGFGPKDGYNPRELKRVADFLRRFVRTSHRTYYEKRLNALPTDDLAEKGAQFVEIMSLFFYHLYRKLVREEFARLRTRSAPKVPAGDRRQTRR